MHIGKSMKMAGTDKSNLNLGIFVNPSTQEPVKNPWLRMIKNRLSVAQWSVRLGYRRNEILRGSVPMTSPIFIM
jgi:hypothetical protein